MAYKFPSREATTRLLDIGVNLGRSGVLTPYAMLEPVSLGGVVIRQASLHNFEDLARKDLRAGDMVVVQRAGDVIPQVVGPVVALRTGKEAPFQPPETCPSCGEPVSQEPGEVAIYCINAACPAQLVRRLEYWASRGAMDIAGLGIRVAQQLLDARLVTDVADLYALTADRLEGLEGFGPKRTQNLLDAIDASRDRPLWRVLTGLGIHGVGSVVAQSLTQHYRSIDALMGVTAEALEEIEGVGPQLAESVVAFFARPRHRELVEKLRGYGVRLVEPEAAAEGPRSLEGLTFVITGTLPTLSREAAAALLQIHGGKVTGSVSRRTNYVVVGENPGAAKLTAARQLGVPMIDEAALHQLIEGQTALTAVEPEEPDTPEAPAQPTLGL